jgi:hypothetical protein
MNIYLVAAISTAGLAAAVIAGIVFVLAGIACFVIAAKINGPGTGNVKLWWVFGGLAVLVLGVVGFLTAGGVIHT